MASARVVQSREPPTRKATASLGELGLVLPSLHLGSFSGMSFDSSSASRLSPSTLSQLHPSFHRKSGSANPSRRSSTHQSSSWTTPNDTNVATLEYFPETSKAGGASTISRTSNTFDLVPNSRMSTTSALSNVMGASSRTNYPTQSLSLSSRPSGNVEPHRSPKQSTLTVISQGPHHIDDDHNEDDMMDGDDEEEDIDNYGDGTNAMPRPSTDDLDRDAQPRLKVVNGGRRVDSVDYSLYPPFASVGSYDPDAPGSITAPWLASTNSPQSPARAFAPTPTPTPDSESSRLLSEARDSINAPSVANPSKSFPSRDGGDLYPNPRESTPYRLPEPSQYPSLAQSQHNQSPVYVQSIPNANASPSRPLSQYQPSTLQPAQYTFQQNQPQVSSKPAPPKRLSSSTIPSLPKGAAYPSPQSQSQTLAIGQLLPIQSLPPVKASPLPIPPPPSGATTLEEICIECMMRDRDMADVDVTSPGIWERESDVWYEELVRREKEEARRGIVPSNTGNKPRSQGGRLTESNLVVWLTMNPKEPAARWQTLEKYIKSQHQFLAAELEARDKALRASRAEDSSIRDTYQHVRRSTQEQSIQRVSVGSGADRSIRGVKLRASAATGYDDDAYASGYASASGSVAGMGVYGPQAGMSSPASTSKIPRNRRTSRERSRERERDVTLLETGLIMERVDLQKEEKAEREWRRAEVKEERRRARKMSRASVGLNSGGDGSSMHSLSAPMQGVNYAASRSQISLTASSYPMNGSTRSAPVMQSEKRLSSSTALIPPRSPMTRGTSQSSVESRGTPRFFGFRHWSGAFGSEASLHNTTGSMMNMHLGLEQDQEMLHADRGDQQWTINQLVDEPEFPPEVTVEDAKAKRTSIGRLWKKMTGGKEKESKGSRQQPQQQEDFSMPLAPPPSLSYLVNRSSGPSERSQHAHRHVSAPTNRSPHSSSASLPSQPRSFSVAFPVGQNLQVPPSLGSGSSQTPISSSPPSTVRSARFSIRDSVGSDDRRFSRAPGEEVQFPVHTDDVSYVDAVDRGPGNSRVPTNQAPYSSSPYPDTSTAYSSDWRQSMSMRSQRTVRDEGRPSSVFSNDKDKALPPLPGELSAQVPSLRPTTSYEFSDYREPSAPFKNETRRQSLGGKVVRPVAPSLSNGGLAPPTYLHQYPGTYAGNMGDISYHVDEFGASTPALGQWMSTTDDGSQREPSSIAPTVYSVGLPSKDKGTKRRSRFTSRLSALFGGGTGGGATDNTSGNRRSLERERELRLAAINGNGLAPGDGERYARRPSHIPGSPPPPCAPGMNERASRSEVALHSDGRPSSIISFPRHSVASSSRRYEGVIQQERDFISMRYPTESERQDLMRRS